MEYENYQEEEVQKDQEGIENPQSTTGLSKRRRLSNPVYPEGKKPRRLDQEPDPIDDEDMWAFYLYFTIFFIFSIPAIILLRNWSSYMITAFEFVRGMEIRSPTALFYQQP